MNAAYACWRVPLENIMPVEFDGKRYERTSTHQKEWGTGLIEELNLRGDERILDVGCGDGALTAKMAEAVTDGTVIGIDASKGMIEAAKRHTGKNLSFQQLDVINLKFNEEFDIVFSNAVLHWVKDHRTLLELLYRALRPSGKLRVNFAGEGNCSALYDIVMEVMKRNDFSSAYLGVDTVEEDNG